MSSSLLARPLLSPRRRLHDSCAATPPVRAPSLRSVLPCAALPEDSGASAAEEDVAFERLRNSRSRVGARAAGAGRPQAKVKVVTPLVDAALDEAPTAAGQAETSALALLTLVFVLILAEGLLVASSGFMSEAQDAWVTSTVLPAFAPTLGVFLLGSSAYGAAWRATALSTRSRASLQAFSSPVALQTRRRRNRETLLLQSSYVVRRTARRTEAPRARARARSSPVRCESFALSASVLLPRRVACTEPSAFRTILCRPRTVSSQ